jgi:hypothetical protein
MMLGEEVMKEIEVLHQNLCGGTEKNYEHVKRPVPTSRFETGASRKRSMSVVNSTTKTP